MDKLFYYQLGKKRGGGGGGSGGGSQQTKYYWEQRPPISVDSANAMFEYKGELYVIHRTGSNYASTVRKYVDGAWSAILDKVPMYQFNYSDFIEFNGLLHYLGNDKNNHYTWDGTSAFVVKSSLPYAAPGNAAFIYNGELYYRPKDKVICKWNEASDTWTEIAISTDQSVGGYRSTFVWNGDVYTLFDQKLYKYDMENGTCDAVATISESYYYDRFAKVIGDDLYFGLSNPNGRLYKYNMITGEVKFICYHPGGPLSNLTSYVYDGKFCVSGTRENIYVCNLVLHELG
jgi:hypothetical protein